MATVPHLYATLADVKAMLGITDAQSNAQIVLIIEGVSRTVDEYCRRHFFPLEQVRFFESEDAQELTLPGSDLLDVSRIDLDKDDDGTYEEAWTSSTYWMLEPANARLMIPPKPYWSIEIPKRNSNYFPVDLDRSIKVTGTWGYYDERSVATTVHTAIGAADTTISLHNANTTLYPGQTIRIDSEQMRVTAVNGINVTVTRAINGTTAATHAVNIDVQTYSYPVVQDAVAHQSVLAFRQHNFPYGTVGVGDVATEPRIMTAAGLHPFVRSMLAPFRLTLMAGD